MKKQMLAVMLSSLFNLSAFAADTYTVDPRHTFPGFEISHLGFSTQRGRFNQTTGKITIDPKAAVGEINISIETNSISTGLPELEEHLRSKDFLDAARFPQITFKSDHLTFNNDKLVGADGKLTLHGVTKTVHLAVDHFYCGLNMIAMKNVCGANATTTIKRTEFGIDKYAPVLADNVDIEIQIEAIKN